MSIRLSKYSLIICLVLLPTFVYGQPGSDPQSIRNEISRLQRQLENANRSGQDDRVRSVGVVRSMPTTPVEEELTLRFYDLSDIFTVSPQYPAMSPDELGFESRAIFDNDNAAGGLGLGGRGGGGVFNVAPTQPFPQEPKNMNLEAAQVSITNLVEAVKRSVQPDVWKQGEATVQVLGNTLLISATDTMHEQIKAVLNLFREHWGSLRTIDVNAIWIRATNEEIRSLVGRKSDEGAGVIDEDKWREFYDAARENKQISYAANLTGHNGQTLYTMSGRRHLFVMDAESLERATYDKDEILRSESVIGLRPVRDTLQDGAAIQVTPLATRGGNFAILDLHSRVNELAPKDPANETKHVVSLAPRNDAKLELDRPSFVAHRISTTVRCPNGAYVLAGGVTLEPGGDEAKPNLYLFVRVNIHTVDEDKPERGSRR